MKKLSILLVDHFDSFTYNVKALFELNNFAVDVIRANRFQPADRYDALVFSPGPSMPQNAGQSLRYFDQYRGKIPILGICLGLQVIGYQLGFAINRARDIMHGKVDTITIKKPSILLAGIDKSFQAVRYHSLIVAAPESLTTATANSDGSPMVVEKPDEALFGVQFHPESLLSEQGPTIVVNFDNFVRQYQGRTTGGSS